jgi:hypothetical protein
MERQDGYFFLINMGGLTAVSESLIASQVSIVI